MSFSPEDPCPICDGYDALPRGQSERCHGFLSDEGKYANCSREEYAGDLEPNSDGETYRHKLPGRCKCGQRHGTIAKPAKKIVRRGGGTTRAEVVTKYRYRDEDDEVLFIVERLRPKSFRQCLPDGTYKLDGVRRVPYRLRELLASDACVFIVEGERDVLRLEKLNVIATTNPGGAGKWRDEYSQYFVGRDVVILPDNDDPGRRHAEQVAHSVYPIASTVRILELPDLPNGGDVSDWITAGGTEDELYDQTNATELWEPGAVAATETPKFNTTDIGNAERFRAHHGEDVRHCYTWKAWMAWTGSHWQRDEAGEIERRATETALSIYDEAARAETREERGALSDWAKACESWPRRETMIKSARQLLVVSPKDFDSNHLLLNCINGTLDLKTCELHDHRREDMITHVVPVDYDPDAECPRWLKFLEETIPDEEVRQYLRRAVGYALTGDITEHAMFFMVGQTATGKSTFVETLHGLLDGYAKTASHDLLLARRDDTHPTVVADLAGARFVSSIETGEGRRLNAALVKWLTGGDTISTRRMYENPFEIAPTWKIWLATNHKPRVDGGDDAIWRRIHLIPFTQCVGADRRDKHLKAKLREEWPGILAWAVEGCRQWQASGLVAPDAVKAATEEYREDMDILGLWIRDCCTVAEESESKASQLYESYRAWCGAHGHVPMSQMTLSLRLSGRGFDSDHRRDGTWWFGIEV